jgi:hypothetical protein
MGTLPFTRSPPHARGRLRNPEVKVVVPEELNLVRELDIGTGVDATQLAAFLRIEAAGARVGILRLNL